MYFDYKEINCRTNWLDNLEEFNQWLMYNQKQCLPKGACGQDVFTTSGHKELLLKKYPDFQSAYEAFKAEWKDYRDC